MEYVQATVMALSKVIDWQPVKWVHENAMWTTLQSKIDAPQITFFEEMQTMAFLLQTHPPRVLINVIYLSFIYY